MSGIFSLTLRDVDGLAKKLKRLESARFDAVVIKNMAEIYNRGKATATPVDTDELRMSLGQRGDLVGYAKDYAAHVEYGHRTRGNGYVRGQRYLKGNVDRQRPIFKRDLVEKLRRA